MLKTISPLHLLGFGMGATVLLMVAALALCMIGRP